MAYTADFLIQKRKDKWNETHSIEYDKKFRDAVANELLTNADLLAEVKRYPSSANFDTPCQKKNGLKSRPSSQ